MSSKKKNIQIINGQRYFTKRALMPDRSWKMVYGKNKLDWERKSNIQYDNFHNDKPEENLLDEMLLKDEISEWLYFIKATCTEKTFDEYTWLVNKYLLPYIGKTKMKEVTTAFAFKLADKVKEQSKNNSVKMAQRVNKRLYSIMNWHVERERGLQVNPISKLVQKDLSREIAKDKEFDTEPVISLVSVQRFLDYFIDSHLFLVFSFMALCGLRIAEALALNWEDIDFDENVIYVHQQITDKGKLTKPKTKASIRYVPYPTLLKPFLLKIRKETGYVTLNTQNNPIRPNNLREKHFHRARKHLLEQYPDFDIKTPHQFRKFFISYNLDNGTNLEVVRQWAGHTDSTITQKIYAKPINETRNKNKDLMSEVMGGSQPNRPHLSIESNNRFDKYSSRPKVAIYK
ncbi:MAG: hypothetical protein CL766_01705 [Chloroflexi bacterium]|nr:hypothetical protein [Chloroflexota bacterium]|tara:strand:- start:1557 stop:2759 length:1203 start_codon:yes stop_codon:yes gene_type:complete